MPPILRFPGLAGLVPIDEEPEPPPATSRCVRCGTYVRLPPSEHFATVCGDACQPVVSPGALKRLPRPFKDRT